MAGIGIAAQLAQIKADYSYIVKQYGNVENYTDTQLEQHERLIAEPCKRVAFECIRESLQEIYEKGYLKKVGTMGHKVIEPLPLFEDERVKEICLRWNLPFPEIQS
ncbi:hypothetical protein OKZ62_001830 [Vibrio navarrensis]|nr:hypothetical protein [Vibrio navarrensis]